VTMMAVHKFLAPRVTGGAAEPCVSCGQYGSSPIHRVKPDNSAAIAIIEAHIPSLSDENEAEISEVVYSTDWEASDLAVRTCACGKRIDGFYEYADHLIDVMSKGLPWT